MNEQRTDSKHKRSLHLLIATNYIVLINYANITSQRSTAPLVCLYGYACLQYDSFASLADRHIADDGSIYAHGPISYGVPGPKLIREIFEGIPHNLVIKTPKYAYQQEYRIIGLRPVECRLLPDENHPGCRIEKYGHAELELCSGLADFSWKVSVPSLEEAEVGLMLKLPHRV
ncbi:hypothetical protein AAAX31_03930 [Collinsella sp. CLA-ER-H5]|uniref:hypothetical protein n=1 Tax=Collinsella sp. CLA-ER-H5 TaxID=3136222 RepID=UPI0032C16766